LGQGRTKTQFKQIKPIKAIGFSIEKKTQTIQAFWFSEDEQKKGSYKWGKQLS